MPQKLPTRARAWGTRFDSLDPSPPPSPPTQDTQPSADGSELKLNQNDIYKGKDDRMPHDASVFVGSLPTNIEPQELTRLLSDHLSQHAEVKNVKVVRDTKGGVCAFVQCEDASAAARLIQTLQSRPSEPFLGRYLRYEPAKAFRSLLISYRAPIQPLPTCVGDEVAAGDVFDENQSIELDLPTALRLWRPRGAKYISILYNDEARRLDVQTAGSVPEVNTTGPVDAFGGAGILICPVKFDTETIRKIASGFGIVEHFGPYKPPAGASNDVSEGATARKIYPSPHDAPRAPLMDDGCWEIKWGHRDDCVNALMTLRRIPYLTVTWAHQPNQSAQDGGQFSPSPNTYHTARFPNNNSYHASATYPIHVRMNSYRDGAARMNGNEYQVSPGVNPNEYQRQGDVRRYGQTTMGGGRVRTETDSSGVTLLSYPSSRHPSASVGVGLSTNLLGEYGVEFGSGTGAKRLDWSLDFPPLGGEFASRADNKLEFAFEKLAEKGVWGGISEKARKDDNGATTAEQGVMSVLPPPTPRAQIQALVVDNVSETPEKRDFASNAVSSIPPTPEFGTSPMTPKTPGYSLLHTPVSQSSELQMQIQGFAGEKAGAEFEAGGDVQVNREFDTFRAVRDREERERVVDPTTIFVGGLEMWGPNAWDERKVRGLFERFGGMEEVRVVRPMNKRSAFAFVRFNNTEAPARAVTEEHNRIYDGRQIRVQLRDNNPPLRGVGMCRYGYRGRGRYHQYGTSRLDPDTLGGDALGLDVGRERGERNVNVIRSDVTGDVDESASRLETSVPMKSVSRDQYSPASSEVQFPSIQSSSSDSFIPENSSEHQYLQEEPTSASATPPPSSVGSSVSVAGPVTPYPIPPMGYLPHQPWMPAFGQPYQYPMPYMGYPGYPMVAAPHSYPTTPGSSDASGPTAQTPWMGMYRPYMQYPAYPYVPDPNQAHQGNGQPPLRPTGFVQNEHGMLVPVYQPEALGQYMSGGQDGQAPTQADGQQQAATWSQCHQPTMFPYPIAMPPMMAMPSQPSQGQGAGNVGWVPNPSFAWPAGQQQQSATSYSNLSPATSSQNNNIPANQAGMGHGQNQSHYQHQGFNGQGQGQHTKRHSRRGNHHNFNNNGRNHSRRSSPDRFGRGSRGNGNGFDNSYNTNHGPSQTGSGAAPPHAGFQGSQMNGEWNQWGATVRSA